MGNKKRQLVTENGRLVKTTDFIGNFVYENDYPVYNSFDEGRIVYRANGTYFAETYIKDHLGNIRVAYGSEGNESQFGIRQVNAYYPFGMNINSLTANKASSYNKNEYLYNGKMFQDELGLDWFDYGARFYDAVIGRWFSIDPASEGYSSLNPYNFCNNNSIIYIDPNGESFYYAQDGTFLFQTKDAKDDVYTWNNEKTKVRIEYDNGMYENEFEGGWDQLMHRGKSVINTDLLLLASTAYGESSTDNVKDEVFGISNAIVNNMDLRGNSSTISGTITGFAFAATDGNFRVNKFNSTSSYKKNGTFMQTAISGSINALSGGKDYSNGATHWAGEDIGSSSEKRATGGLLFTNTNHDLFKLGSKTINNAPITTYFIDKKGKILSERGSYSYTWETTAAYGGTTFLKKTEQFINATGAPRY